MAPNPKVIAACRAMGNLGIHESKVKPVLKKLYKLYDKNWALIEEENYRALADAIFEEDENGVPEPDPNQKKRSNRVDEGELDNEETHVREEPLRPKKRLRLRGEEVRSSHPQTSCAPSTAASLLKVPKLEDGIEPENSTRLQPQSAAVLSDGNGRIEAHQVPPRDGIDDKGKQPMSSQDTPRGRRFISDGAPPAVPITELAVEPRIASLPKNKMPQVDSLITPKDEPIEDMPDYVAPISVVLSEPPSGRDSSMMNGAAGQQEDHDTVTLQCREVNPSNEPPSGRDSSMMNCAAGQQDGHDTVALPCKDEEVGGEDNLRSSNEDMIFDTDIALSPMEEEACEMATTNVGIPKESEAHDTLMVGGDTDLFMPSCIGNGSINARNSSLVAPQIPVSVPCPCSLDDAVAVSKMVGNNDFLAIDYEKELVNPVSPKSVSLVAVAKLELPADKITSAHQVNDLTKGEERVKISCMNNITNDFPPSFHYIPRNLVFQNAYVNFSLCRIGSVDCCSTCMGNCVLSSKPCSCANKTGDGFAYTEQGLLKEEFLEECIAISRNPKNIFYCKDCPLERSRNDDCLEPCKGHLRRKFIKECWSKCGCGKSCGNRVVQRGITCNLQVFLTSEGNGWGLRTLEDLPKGAFVCEFVGEILTTKELHERNLKYHKNRKYTYPVLLDADWETRFVKDKEALCLYAASYGNVARFINHRCLDANLVEIPIEVESPDHHYYHFAFFTSRKIAAQEELTWDYGINFDDDDDQSVELFECKCGSKFCRNMKRSNRSSRSSVSR